MFDLSSKRIWVTGATGMVGSALCRRLAAEDCEIVTVDRRQCDLRNQAATEAWMELLAPDVVVVAAATVGGIMANSQEPAPFLYDNLAIAANLIHAAYKQRVSKLLFLGSSCIYPRMAKQPLREEYLLSGPLEPTNKPYAIAKLAGIELCQAYRRQYGSDFISCLPTNLYGPGDRFDTVRGHVIPALLAQMHAAKETSQRAVMIGGSGRPRREFLYVDDLADALVHLLKNYSDETPINVGCGSDLSIADLAFLIRETVGYSGSLEMDPLFPDGTPLKRLDVTRLTKLGWRARTSLEDGLRQTYAWYRSSIAESGSSGIG